MERPAGRPPRSAASRDRQTRSDGYAEALNVSRSVEHQPRPIVGPGIVFLWPTIGVSFENSLDRKAIHGLYACSGERRGVAAGFDDPKPIVESSRPEWILNAECTSHWSRHIA